MSAGSPDAYLAASPVRASKGLGTVRNQKSIPDQPAALDEALHTIVPSARSPAQVHAASAGTSSTLLQPDCGHQDLSCCQPDSRQQPSSDAEPNSTSIAPEHLQPLSTSESGHSSTLPVNDSTFLSTLSQPRSIRAPSPTSCPQGGAIVANFIHSSTGSLPNTPEISTHLNAQQPEALHSALASPISQVNHASEEFSEPTMSASLTHAELGAKDSSDEDLADPSNLKEGRHTQSGTASVSEPSYRSEHAAVVSESESRSADDLMRSEPANGSADAGTVSEPASSLPGILSSKAGSPTSNHAPHVTSLADSAKPTVSSSPSQELPTIRLSQQAVSAHDPETSETGIGTDAVPGPSAAGSDSPHTEQQATAFGSDVVPGSSTAGSDSPQSEQQATAFGTEGVPGPSTAGYVSPQAERQSSSAAASTSGSDEAAPGMSTFAQRLKAQKGTAGNVTSWPGWFFLWVAESVSLTRFTEGFGTAFPHLNIAVLSMSASE